MSADVMSCWYFFLTAFSQESFNDFVKQIQVPSIWIGVLSLTWEGVAALLK